MPVQTYVHGTNAVNIARSIETAVADGRAAAGERLPAVRPLAATLGVSPATVAAAYRLLQERGIVVADGRRGTRVRPASPAAPLRAAALPSHVRDLAGGNPDPALLPDVEAVIRRLAVPRRLYGDTLNQPKLLELAGRQFAADGVPAEAIAILGGALDGVERVLREHLRAGDRVIVEDPCFTGVLDLLNANSFVAVGVAIDDEGLLPSELEKALRGASALIVTPRAQNPTGAAFSARRARALRTLLRARPDLLVIEDDHAGPVAGAPYVTLIEPSRERWAVVRSVSKSLGPDLRLAAMAADRRTISRVEGRQNLGIRWVSHILQDLVAALWSDRSVARLLARAERTYAQRRHALLTALRDRNIECRGLSGLNIWIPLREEAAVMQSLMQLGWAVQAGERYRLKSGPGIRVTVSALLEEEAVRFADDLAEVLAPARRVAMA